MWDLTDGSKRNFFLNRNAPGSRLSALTLVNEDDEPMLLTGTDDGVVRLWHHIDDPHRVGQRTSWRALSDMLVSNRGKRTRHDGLVGAPIRAQARSPLTRNGAQSQRWTLRPPPPQATLPASSWNGNNGAAASLFRATRASSVCGTLSASCVPR